jgi:TRAP-type C4-dicarboxylate transport system substrate-binding protein
MKKQILYTMLVVVIAIASLAFVGCGNSGDSAEAPDTSTETPADESAGTPADEPAETPADESANASVTYEPLQIKTATSYNEVDFGGQMIKFFMEYLEEHSGGAITGEAYYGGSFCQAPEINDYVMSGDLSFSICQPVYAMTYFPFSWGLAGYDSISQPTDILMASLYENEETAALIDAQGKTNNLKLIGYTEAGPSLFWSTKPITGYKDAKGLTIGSPINLDIYASYGFNTVAIEPPDMYDSLQRGVCDLVAFSATDGTTMKIYEVAPYIGDMRAYFSHSSININYDLWDSLPQETKDLFIEAAWATKNHSAEKANEITEDLFNNIIPGTDGAYNEFTVDEGKDFNFKSMSGNGAMLRDFAKNLGDSEGMEVIIQYWADSLEQEGF